MPIRSLAKRLMKRLAMRSSEIPFLRGYSVFNVEQIDGLPAVYYAKQPRSLIQLLDSNVRRGSSQLLVEPSATAGIARFIA